MKRWTSFTLFVTAVAVLALSSVPRSTFAATPEPPVVLKVITSMPEKWESNDVLFWWMKTVNKFGKGRIKLEFTGDPAVFPSFEQLQLVKRGTVDIDHIVPGYIAGMLPEALALEMGQVPIKVRREAGVISLVDEIAQRRHGIKILGLTQGLTYYFYSIKPVNKADFSGMKFRSIPIYDPVIRGLGGVPTTIAPAEVYTALESKLVDGIGWPCYIGYTAAGFQEILRYRLTPGWNATGTALYMNLKRYNALPSDLKKLLEDCTELAEDYGWPYYREQALRMQNDLIREGKLTIIKWSPEDNERFLKIAWEKSMEDLIVKPSPEYGQRLKKLLEPLRDKQIEPIP